MDSFSLGCISALRGLLAKEETGVSHQKVQRSLFNSAGGWAKWGLISQSSPCAACAGCKEHRLKPTLIPCLPGDSSHSLWSALPCPHHHEGCVSLVQECQYRAQSDLHCTGERSSELHVRPDLGTELTTRLVCPNSTNQCKANFK